MSRTPAMHSYHTELETLDDVQRNFEIFAATLKVTFTPTAQEDYQKYADVCQAFIAEAKNRLDQLGMKEQTIFHVSVEFFNTWFDETREFAAEEARKARDQEHQEVTDRVAAAASQPKHTDPNNTRFPDYDPAVTIQKNNKKIWLESQGTRYQITCVSHEISTGKVIIEGMDPANQTYSAVSSCRDDEPLSEFSGSNELTTALHAHYKGIFSLALNNQTYCGVYCTDLQNAHDRIWAALTALTFDDPLQVRYTNKGAAAAPSGKPTPPAATSADVSSSAAMWWHSTRRQPKDPALNTPDSPATTAAPASDGLQTPAAEPPANPDAARAELEARTAARRQPSNDASQAAACPPAAGL